MLYDSLRVNLRVYNHNGMHVVFYTLIMCNSPLELLLLWVWALDDGCFLVMLHYAGRKQLALKYFKGWWRTGVIVLTPIIFCPIPFAFDLTSVSFCASLPVSYHHLF